jgi:hypothetical protein
MKSLNKYKMFQGPELVDRKNSILAGNSIMQTSEYEPSNSMDVAEESHSADAVAGPSKFKSPQRLQFMCSIKRPIIEKMSVTSSSSS